MRPLPFRVRCSPDVGQGLALAGVAAQYPGLLAQAEQYVVAFLEKNRQQFVVNGRCRRRRAGQGRRRERGGGGFALNAAAEGVEIGFALRQSVDEETDQRQTFGERGELRGVGAGGSGDGCRRARTGSPPMPQVPGMVRAPDVWRIGASSGVRSVVSLGQRKYWSSICSCRRLLCISGDLLDEQPFTAHNFVECRRFAVIDRNAAGNTGWAVDHGRPGAQFAIQLLEMHPGILEEQNRSGDFHRLHRGAATGLRPAR
jgi:hypothetical protein